MMLAQKVVLSNGDRSKLKAIVRSPHSEPRQILRAKIILLAAKKKQNKEIAETLGISNQKVARWKKRFLLNGVSGIMKDAPRTGRPVLITQTDVDEILHILLNETPNSSERWSVRTLANRVKKTRYAVHKILSEFGINLERNRDVHDILGVRVAKDSSKKPELSACPPAGRL